MLLLVEAGRLVVASLEGFVLRMSHAGRREMTAKSTTILSKGEVVVAAVSVTESAGVGATVGDGKTAKVGRGAWNTICRAVVGKSMMTRARGRRTLGMVGMEHERPHVLVACVKVEFAALLRRRRMLQQQLLVLTMTKGVVAAAAAKVRAISAVVTLCLAGAAIAQEDALVVEVIAGVGVVVLVVLGTPPSGGTRLARGNPSRPGGDLTAQDADGIQVVGLAGAMVHLVESQRLSLNGSSRRRVVFIVIIVKGRVGQIHDALQTLVDAVGETKPVAGAFVVLHGGERLLELGLGAKDDAAVNGVVAVLARDGAVAVGTKVEVDNSAAAAAAEAAGGNGHRLGVDGLDGHGTWILADGGWEIGEIEGESLPGALDRALGAGVVGDGGHWHDSSSSTSGRSSLGLTVVRQVDSLRFDGVHDGVLLSLWLLTLGLVSKVGGGRHALASRGNHLDVVGIGDLLLVVNRGEHFF